MAVKGCPFHIPADPASLQGPAVERPLGLPDWGHANLSGLIHSHKVHFAPRNQSNDGWCGAMIASQFRTDCSRLLLVEDDMNTSGVGFTAKIWAFALLLAVRDNRVLLEVSRVQGVSRWCDREPFSFQCLYEPWSHCQIPPPNTPQAVPGGRPMKLTTWPHGANVVRTGLGRIHRQGQIWYSAKHSPITVASHFLFRPRKWVRDIGECVMRKAGLRPGHFVSIHIRYSVEKLAEGKRLGATLPALSAYHPLAESLATDAGTRKIFLQTASVVGLEDFTSFASKQKLKVFYTDNPRSEHDSWGGWLIGAEMMQSAVGAVNAYISSLAAVTASPGISLWTDFLRRTHPLVAAQDFHSLSVRCPPSLAAASWYDVFGQRAATPMPALASACRVKGSVKPMV